MIKQSISDRYKVDPYGTEEIISSAANSCAPILTIDYGDEVQTDAEFTIRPTKGSLDTNISPVAVLNSIKGNTIVWNQLVNLSNAAVTVGTLTVDSASNQASASLELPSSRLRFDNVPVISGHKYYCGFVAKSSIDGTIRIQISEGWVDFGGDALVANTEKRISKIVTATQSGNASFPYMCLYYYEGMTFPYTLSSKNTIVIDLTLIYGSGNEPSTPEAFEADYYKWFGKQLTYEPYSAGELRPVKMDGIKTIGANNSWVSINPIPVTTLKGKLTGQGNSVVVFPDGMKKVGSVYDEIRKENSKVKAIKRIGNRAYQSGDEADSTVLTDGNTTTFYVLSTPEEYILDAFDVQKMMLGANEVQKVYLGSDVIFEETN